jgi:integrase
MVRMFRRGNGRLYVEYKLDGRTVQKSTGLLDTPQNRTLVKKEVIPALERKLLLGEVHRSKPKKFQHYADVFLSDKSHLKTYDQMKSIIKVLNERFGDMSIHKITRGDVKDFVRDRLKVNTPKTLGNYLTPLRGVFDLAIDDEIIKDNPCNNIKLPSHKAKEVEPFTPKQVQMLLDNAGDWMRLFLAISFYTGMRTGEVLALMHSEIDLSAKVIHIKRSINKGKLTLPKTDGSIRDVPILNDLLPYLPKKPKSLWVLPKPDGTPYPSFVGSKQREWRLLLEKCKIPYRKVNATRHTFIVSMLKYSDLSILEVAQLAGHTNTKMIVSNYGKFIKGEHLKIDRNVSIFTDKSTDSIA